ncbi:MAG: mannosyltransferase [Mycobacteriaceae bacterium]
MCAEPVGAAPVRTTLARMPASPRPRARAAAVLLLALSVLGRMLNTFGLPYGSHLVDLRVYTYGAATVFDGRLYSYTFSEFTPGFPLPFTYPPFAAMVMWPLHLVSPFTVLSVLWQLATVAALWGVVTLSLRLLLGRRADEPCWRAVALVWTAVGTWLEPVHTTLDFGQVNVFLALGVLAAASTHRWWLAGALVGVLAGFKLTPAVTGLYFLAQRNVRAAVASAVVFAATVALSFVVVPGEARQYFTGVGLDAGRVGPVGSAINQSLRGVLSRFVGHDVGTGPIWGVAVLAAAALTLLACRRLDPGDRLGVLVAVQLLGLLASPISWSHHWVWLVPALLWLVHGPRAGSLAARVLATVVLVVLVADVIKLLLALQPSIWDFSRPVVLSVAAAAYPLLAVAILGLMVHRPRPDLTAPHPRDLAGVGGPTAVVDTPGASRR